MNDVCVCAVLIVMHTLLCCLCVYMCVCVCVCVITACWQTLTSPFTAKLPTKIRPNNMIDHKKPSIDVAIMPPSLVNVSNFGFKVSSAKYIGYK